VGGNVFFQSVSTDSRAIQSGQLFVALRGERFDGHEFVNAVAAQGAVAAMVDRAWAATNPVPLPLLVVEDTRLGLGQLAAGWRSALRAAADRHYRQQRQDNRQGNVRVILRAQARIDGFDPDLAVLATKGNLNNDIGLPLMLLRLSGNHRAAVIEMGMNRPGEIGYLTQLARPTVALVNNAQRAHLQGMGSVNEVAREKGAIYDGLAADGVAVINADDAFASYWKAINAGRRTLTFRFVGRGRCHCPLHDPRLCQRRGAHVAAGRHEVPFAGAGSAQRAQRPGGSSGLSGRGISLAAVG
jgi:UDP-N-acetylmuramoyl-tripeptide--D-alanyl-D-alanine ligase